MTVAGPLLARDFASMLLDGVPDTPCADGSVSCTLRSLVDYLFPLSLVFVACVALGFVLAIWFSIISARLERRRQPLQSTRKRLLSGPIHTDGAWVRLIEDEHGRRIVEVLEGANWRPATQDLAELTLDMPIATRPPG